MKNNLFKTEVKKLSDAVVISFYEKGTKRLMGTISATVNHCLICGKASVDQEKKDICDGCKMVLDKYTREGNRLYTKEETKEPAKWLSSSTPIEDTKVSEDTTPNKEVKEDKATRKTKVVVAYKKGNDPMLNKVRIENLNELYDTFDKSLFSIGKFETFLKCAALGLSYQAIAQKLNIQELSVRHDYAYLSRYNLVVNSDYKPLLTIKVLYSTANEAPCNLVGMDKSAYDLLKRFLNNWCDIPTIVKETKVKTHTIVNYISRLHQLNLIEKRKTSKSKEYRFASI